MRISDWSSDVCSSDLRLWCRETMDQRRQERAPLDALVLPGLPAQRRAPPTRALAYNIANFLRTLALSKEIEQWSLTTLCVKLVGIGARIVRHGPYVVFQLAEVVVPRVLDRKSKRLNSSH